ncbi:hypothetical protein ACLOJK_020250 [Asimina triloba]
MGSLTCVRSSHPLSLQRELSISLLFSAIDLSCSINLSPHCRPFDPSTLSPSPSRFLKIGLSFSVRQKSVSLFRPSLDPSVSRFSPSLHLLSPCLHLCRSLSPGGLDPSPFVSRISPSLNPYPFASISVCLDS